MTPDPLQIRDARDDERAAVRELTLRAYAQYAAIMTPTAWAGLDDAVRVALGANVPGVDRIVAVLGDRIVGCVHLYPPSIAAYGDLAASAPIPELRLLAVADDARGLGVGRALVTECVRRARAAGAPALGLHTSESMAVAMSMYERMGFVRVPSRDFLPDGAELVKAYELAL